MEHKDYKRVGESFLNGFVDGLKSLVNTDVKEELKDGSRTEFPSISDKRA